MKHTLCSGKREQVRLLQSAFLSLNDCPGSNPIAALARDFTFRGKLRPLNDCPGSNPIAAGAIA
jgi:hypothetical protein